MKTELPWRWGDFGKSKLPVQFEAHDGPVISRAVRVAAPPAVVFRWLCQLRVAPYSYDIVDNLGRRSPRALTPGLESLAVGQRFATIFSLVDWAQDDSLALEVTSPSGIRLFGRFTLVYQTVPLGDGSADTTLRADFAIERPRSPLARARAETLAWGDLVMMRRQLLLLADLSERTAQAPRAR